MAIEETSSMTTLTAYPTVPLQLSWPRVAALSGTLSLHALAVLLLLVPPVAFKLMRPPVEDTVYVRQIFVEPPPPVMPQEPHPQPLQHHPKPIAVTTPVPTPQPPVIVDTPSDIQAVDPTPIASVEHAAPADTAPTPLAYGSQTHVPYPIEAARRHEHGTVILRVLVGVDGHPQTIEIETSSGSPRLDAAARAAVEKWTFRAGTKGGLSFAAWARIPIAFDLQTL
jgi:periplasmic protein TonB